jgi:hypothetical protein
MAWGDATFKGKKAVGTTAGALYEVGYILEWQLVTRFFDYFVDGPRIRASAPVIGRVCG